MVAHNKRMLVNEGQNDKKLSLILKKLDEIEEKLKMMKKMHKEVSE